MSDEKIPYIDEFSTFHFKDVEFLYAERPTTSGRIYTADCVHKAVAALSKHHQIFGEFIPNGSSIDKRTPLVDMSNVVVSTENHRFDGEKAICDVRFLDTPISRPLDLPQLYMDNKITFAIRGLMSNHPVNGKISKLDITSIDVVPC